MDEMTLEYRTMTLREFKYLPMFYLLPKEFLVKRRMDQYPRDPMTFATDPYWKSIYQSQYFEVQLMDLWAWMMWQTFGIRGGFDSYSPNEPFVRIAINLPVWTAIVAELGMTTDLLASLSQSHGELPFTSEYETAHNCGLIAKRLLDLPDLKLREIREVIASHRSHDDFSKRYSNVKIDFYRKYYHTRSKRAKMVPLEEETDDHILYGYVPNGFSSVEHRSWVDGLCKQLAARDAEILKLLDRGYTQQEIAKALGYANHSGINKRIKNNIRPLLLKDKQGNTSI